MHADDRTIAVAAALGLPVYRLRSIEVTAIAADHVEVRPVYAFHDADVEGLRAVERRYPIALAGMPAGGRNEEAA